MSGETLSPGSRESKKGDAVVRVSRPEEEAIEIGNGHRYQPSTA